MARRNFYASEMGVMGRRMSRAETRNPNLTGDGQSAAAALVPGQLLSSSVASDVGLVGMTRVASEDAPGVSEGRAYTRVEGPHLRIKFKGVRLRPGDGELLVVTSPPGAEFANPRALLLIPDEDDRATAHHLCAESSGLWWTHHSTPEKASTDRTGVLHGVALIPLADSHRMEAH